MTQTPPKNAKTCYLCGKPIKDGVQYMIFKRKIHGWDWDWHAQAIGDKAGNPAFCKECEQNLIKLIDGNVKINISK